MYINNLKKSEEIEIALKLIKKIKEKAMEIEEIRIMEVCGTHTKSIYNNGIDKLLPQNIKLISGPGCPVCVTPQNYIDGAIELSKKKNIIITSFGDMIKIPGTKSSLREEKAIGRDIRIIYSPLDALKIAQENKTKEVVFLAVGFETTAPLIALTLIEAKINNINNFSILHSLKTMPNAMKALILDEKIKIDGFICPGHVATIIGSRVFEQLSKKYKLPMAVCGFKAIDILCGILYIITMKEKDEYNCINFYKTFVKGLGNKKSKEILEEVFINGDSIWRGLGNIKNTGYMLKEEYSYFDANIRFALKDKNIISNKNCICGEILKGIKMPKDCILFGKVCTPSNPIGPCMVSSEGTCGIVYENI
ncbi:hydrogenase formation protein HypD [Clostridium sp. CTA-5]